MTQPIAAETSGPIDAMSLEISNRQVDFAMPKALSLLDRFALNEIGGPRATAREISMSEFRRWRWIYEQFVPMGKLLRAKHGPAVRLIHFVSAGPIRSTFCMEVWPP